MLTLKNKAQSLILWSLRRKVIRDVTRKMTQRGLLTDQIWKRLPVEGTFRVKIEDGFGFHYVADPQDAIGRVLFWKGLHDAWESETVAIFQNYAQRSNVVLDVGANTGVYSLIACSVNDSAQVVAFEPVPRIYELFRRNLSANGYEDRCDARSMAVSNHDGEIQFHVPWTDVPTSASLHAEGFRGVGGELIKVPVVTLDAVASGLDTIDLVKIDVEGFEDTVLEGMSATLKTDEPAIILECNSDGPYNQVNSILKKNGYHIYHLTKTGPTPIFSVTPALDNTLRNYLAVKRDSHIGLADSLMAIGEHANL